MSWPPHAHRGGTFREGVTPAVRLVVAAPIVFEVEIARRGAQVLPFETAPSFGHYSEEPIDVPGRVMPDGPVEPPEAHVSDVGGKPINRRHLLDPSPQSLFGSERCPSVGEPKAKGHQIERSVARRTSLPVDNSAQPPTGSEDVLVVEVQMDQVFSGQVPQGPSNVPDPTED